MPSPTGQASKMHLRFAKLSDLDALIEVQRAGAIHALAHIFPQDAFPFPHDEIYARWIREIDDPEIEAYVIESHDGQVSGFAASRRSELLHFGTAVRTWGTGLAVDAHNEIMLRLAAADVTQACLRVFKDNHRAVRFYEKLGWHRTGKLTRTSFPPFPVLVQYEHEVLL